VKILASDPGLQGALAAYDTAARRLDIYAMPTLKREMSNGKLRDTVDEDELLAFMRVYADLGFTHLVKEKVGGMRGQKCGGGRSCSAPTTALCAWPPRLPA
jgi:hypothetical protein